jgi:hypothetical protein
LFHSHTRQLTRLQHTRSVTSSMCIKPQYLQMKQSRLLKYSSLIGPSTLCGPQSASATQLWIAALKGKVVPVL